MPGVDLRTPNAGKLDSDLFLALLAWLGLPSHVLHACSVSAQLEATWFTIRVQLAFACLRSTLGCDFVAACWPCCRRRNDLATRGARVPAVTSVAFVSLGACITTLLAQLVFSGTCEFSVTENREAEADGKDQCKVAFMNVCIAMAGSVHGLLLCTLSAGCPDSAKPVWSHCAAR